MSDTPSVGAFAIVPSNDLPAAIPFWERLGFVRTGGDHQYVIMSGWGCEVHLTQAGGRPLARPGGAQPFSGSSFARRMSMPSQRGSTI